MAKYNLKVSPAAYHDLLLALQPGDDQYAGFNWVIDNATNTEDLAVGDEVTVIVIHEPGFRADIEEVAP